MQLKNNFFWIGEQDPNLKVFDIIMRTDYGTSYNSYLIKGKNKNAIFETVKIKFFQNFIHKIEKLIPSQQIDYLIVNHTEPDHVGSVIKILEKYPNIKIVGSKTAIMFLKQITNKEFDFITVKTGDYIDLGEKTLKFISAPFLHWPDSMYTYIPEDKTLITCDSFGCHYSFDELLISKLKNFDDYYIALEYYFKNIFGPFKKYVISAINKISPLDINMICPGHGPVLDKNPHKIIEIYNNYAKETKPYSKKLITIPYVSAYGYTEEIKEIIIQTIKEKYDFEIISHDLVTADTNEVFDNIYWSDGILFGTPTINSDALKPIWDIVTSLSPIVHNGKIASAFGSYGWSGEGVPNIIERLKQLRLKVFDGIKVNFKCSEQDKLNVKKFAEKFAKSVETGIVEIQKKDNTPSNIESKGEKKYWKCTVCGEIYESVLPPSICPACNAGQDSFVMLEKEKLDFNSKSSEKIIIAGASVAGISAAEEIRKRNSNCEIIVISNENIFPYYRPMLTKGFSQKEINDSFFIKKSNWYKKNNITLKIDSQITKFDFDNKYVEINNKSKISYDKLIITIGADCNIPRIKNVNLKNVLKIRNISDVENLKNSIEKNKNAVVIGGGILGLEAASELIRNNINVHVIETENTILSKMLDNEGSNIIESLLNNNGINLIKGDCVTEILGKSKVEGILLKSGKKIDCNIIIISAGIKKNTQLLEKSKIFLDNGIVVNSKMQTNLSNVYAAGDIINYENNVNGLWPIAKEQGKIAGINIVGDSAKYTPKLNPFSFHSINLKAYSIGNTTLKNDEFDYIHHKKDKNNKIYKKLWFKNSVLLSAILINDLSAIGKISKNINKKINLKDFIKEI